MKNQFLLEILADISFIAGENNYFTGDSRNDVSQFILWAKKFQTLHSKTNWDEVNYLLTIQEYTLKMINQTPKD
jgi:hypothetical protein